MPAALDIIALRSFAAIADFGGYHRAAEVLHVSQSTVSQHIRKLEATLGRPLLTRDGRVMRLTQDGEALLVEARALLAAHDLILDRFGATGTRTVVVGATEHGADYLLPHVQLALRRDLPDVQIRFRLDRGTNLNDGLDRGSVDVAILLGAAHEGSTQAGSLPLAWYAAPKWVAPPAPAPIPLVAIDSPCTIRSKAVRTLELAGRSHTVVAEAGYLAGVVNAVRAGVGVAVLAHPGPPPAGLEVRDDLPPVEAEPLHVRARTSAPPALARTIISAVHAALD